MRCRSTSRRTGWSRARDRFRAPESAASSKAPRERRQGPGGDPETAARLAGPLETNPGFRSGASGRARSVRIERAQTRQEALDLELKLYRERPCERSPDLQIDVDEILRKSKLRLALTEADACVPEQLIEQQELALQIRRFGLRQIDLSGMTER